MLKNLFKIIMLNLFVSCQVFGMDKGAEKDNPISFSESILGDKMEIKCHTGNVSMNLNCGFDELEETRGALRYLARKFPDITLPDQMVQEINQKYAAAYTDNPTKVINEICTEACELVRIIYYLYTVHRSNQVLNYLLDKELTLNGSNLKLTPSINYKGYLSMAFKVHDTKHTPNRGMFGTITLNNGLYELNLRNQQQGDFIVGLICTHSIN
jgi:hypothetical protein